jgi:phosphopantothenoylcysteine decarboxylase/phosphopantothenate--cysteine ligase
VRRGADVTLVAGPTSVTPPAVAALVRVRSAAEMHEAVMRAAADMDLVVMSAAVADYTPAQRAAGKIAKQEAPLTLTLERTRDILADLGAMRASRGTATPVLVGFAAETDDVVRKARDKRTRKRVDAIVANDVSQPIAASTWTPTPSPSSPRTARTWCRCRARIAWPPSSSTAPNAGAPRRGDAGGA